MGTAQTDSAQPPTQLPAEPAPIVLDPPMRWSVPLTIGVEWMMVLITYLVHLTDRPLTEWRHWLLWTLALAGFTMIEWVESWFIKRNLGWLYLLIRLAFLGWVIWLSQLEFISTLLFFIVAANSWGLSRRLGLLTLGLSVLLAVGITYGLFGFTKLYLYINLIPWFAGLIFVSGTVMLAKREEEARNRSEALLTELSAAHQQLRTYAEQAEELATIRERNRIAREIHDSLGHYLTIVNVQLETALAWRSRDADRADRAVSEAKRLASEALTDVRRSVASLRPSALDTLALDEAITAQVADFREHSGLPVDLRIEGDSSSCSQAAGLALYRAVQEGLTNIRKHAAAKQVAVYLRFGPTTTELTITDDGRGLPQSMAPATSSDGGFGLLGLRERMALLGGTLDIRAGANGGTELQAMVPHIPAH